MSITLLTLGDIMLGEDHYHYRRGIRTKYENNYSNIITNEIKKELFKRIDMLFFNFEFSLVEPGFKFERISSLIFRAREKCLQVFPDNVKKIANIANNHFSQHGKDASKYTKEILRKNNFIIIGESNKPTTVNKKNIKMEFWGVSLIKDNNFCNEYYFSDYYNLPAELSEYVKGNDEYWVISIHWGDEYIKIPSKRQIDLAHKLSEMGFDLIIGHHPHVIQPVDVYNNTIIIYSLGNFIFDHNFSNRTKQGLVVSLLIDRGIKVEKTFKTYQYKYIVSNYKPIEFKDHIKEKQLYSVKLKFVNYFMRILMKIELLIHLYKVNGQTLRFLISRIIKHKKQV